MAKAGPDVEMEVTIIVQGHNNFFPSNYNTKLAFVNHIKT